MAIKDNVLKVFGDIQTAANKAGRKASEITLVGVTKFTPLDAIGEAIEAGVKHVAENRVQEAESKFPQLLLKYPSLTTNLIGHLQTNKAKDAIKVCRLIQSVDSLKLAAEIQKQAQKTNAVAEILVQFNTAREEQKFGAMPEEAFELLESIGQLSNVKVKGLMAMAPFTEDQGVVRKTFADLRLIKEGALQRFSGHANLHFEVLSMGMSGDLQIAVEEGSTMVRVGSAIFKEAYVQ